MTQKQCASFNKLKVTFIVWLVSKKKNQLKKLTFLFDEPKSFENSISWNGGYIIWFQRCIGTQSVHPHVLFDEPPSELSVFKHCFTKLCCIPITLLLETSSGIVYLKPCFTKLCKMKRSKSIDVRNFLWRCLFWTVFKQCFTKLCYV
jgi:hypothetical protein